MKRFIAAALMAAFLLPATAKAQECLTVDALQERAANTGANTVMVDLQSAFGARIDGVTRALFIYIDSGIVLVGFEIGGCMSDPIILGAGKRDVKL